MKKTRINSSTTTTTNVVATRFRVDTILFKFLNEFNMIQNSVFSTLWTFTAITAPLGKKKFVN